MKLASEGIDLFYVDESVREPLFVATSVCIPFLRPNGNDWEFVWADYLASATKWRRELSKKHSIRFREELHAFKLMRSQGLYHKTGRNLSTTEAVTTYKDALATLTWLPKRSIMSAYATDATSLMGYSGVAACLFGLFQRIRTHCQFTHVNGMMFFDEGNSSYIRLHRMAQRYLPTGSQYGAWGPGKATRNMPLDMFPKDGNIKKSDLSYFIQIADLIAYAARVKLENERRLLSAKRVEREHHLVYDCVPKDQLNTLATMKRRDAIAPT